MLIRPIQEPDWAPILRLQDEAYHALDPESEVVLRSKVQLGPETCLVACQAERVIGYCLAHPWLANEPASLYQIYRQPKAEEGLYLHDMVVSPQAQGQGVAVRFLQHLARHARTHNFNRISLVAVQGADRYWLRHQFCPLPCTKDLSAYGPGAVYMCCTVN